MLVAAGIALVVGRYVSSRFADDKHTTTKLASRAQPGDQVTELVAARYWLK